MDYSSVSSEIIESLDILSPRVKRFHQNILENPTSNNRQGKINVYRRDNINYLTGNTATAHRERAAASSTSLILKKTSQREILKKYSVVSYTSLLRANRNPSGEQSTTAKDKPLIKVTVIPKTQTSTKSHRRRKPSKKIQNTVSNHENSIHTKNLYLVVAGRKREKVYEIKTTGSADFSTDVIEYCDHEEDSLKDRSNIKEVIQSLNMDKKKKKGKNKKDANNLSIEVPNVESHHDCRCGVAARENGRNVEPRRSRVRIFGQVGLTEDERYVLKCDAMLDGEPIMTRFESERTRSPDFHIADAGEPTKYHTNYKTMACYGGHCANDNYSRHLKDSNIQVDFGDNRNPNDSIFRSVGNQGTQVNFSVCPSKTILPTKRNQTIQCNYASLAKTINITKNDSDNKLVQECQSPLVIISVYPKQETSNDVKNAKDQTATNTRPGSPRNLTYVSQDVRKVRNNDCCRNFQKRNDKSTKNTPNPSRSPSPNRKNFDMQKRKDIYNADKITRTRTNSPNRPPNQLPNRPNRTTQNKERRKANPKRTITEDSDKYACKNMRKINQILSSRGLKKTNTEIKKAIVDDYTRRITESMNRYAELSPKHETSKVKINIDSENEYYDVQFEQGNRTTDLQIRKTLKEAASQKHDRPVSPDNLFMLPEKENKEKPFMHPKNDRKDDTKNVGIRNSKLNVRDSIELCQRRECGLAKKDVQTHKSTKQNACARDTDFLAPIKHYKGDDCELPNPVERDNQIRRLLGINRAKNNNCAAKQNYVFGGIVGDHGLFDCVYKRNCEKSLETGLSLLDLGTCHEIAPANKKINTNLTQIESAIGKTSLYQQLIVNRNIQVFLQVEQFNKHKPIILSRKQYDKVKRTIQRSVSKKISQEKSKKPINKRSLISVGEVRQRNKQENPKYECNKQTQTDLLHSEIKKRCDIGNGNDRFPITANEPRIKYDEDFCDQGNAAKMQTIVLFDSKEAKYNMNKRKAIEPQCPMSSLEIHCASVGYMKRVTFSSTNVGSLSTSSMLRRNDSLITIFKGHKRSVTPNLGTSDITLSPREVNSAAAKGYMNPSDSRAKKPFLRRLMSCLVMRSRTSEVKLPVRATPLLTSVNSSVDSYQFSTSLGAIQMSSSLYDTTASFYTNHSVLPIVNSKMKRGFFNSVRGFLTNRKS